MLAMLSDEKEKSDVEAESNNTSNEGYPDLLRKHEPRSASIHTLPCNKQALLVKMLLWF
jgi:hypothetical protein